ncbi:hypothetical protein F0U62_06590 [Cystobacter fuscus]|uniref:hypothetical protein n=1 Tax=Cystobacter fuscus TaxID=43 RepID=UPI002B2C0457|nr:hypothetical protein F0U62_06590 [Cystobacter fuscus]
MQTVTTSSSSIPTAGVLTPNQYVLGGKGVRVEYSATSITGDPLLHYRDATHEVNARGEEIRQQETELGTLVTVTLEPDADAGALLLTVIIPRAQLRDTGGEVQIVTNAVLTRSRFPRLPADAQLQSYRFLSLRGVATFVVS